MRTCRSMSLLAPMCIPRLLIAPRHPAITPAPVTAGIGLRAVFPGSLRRPAWRIHAHMPEHVPPRADVCTAPFDRPPATCERPPDCASYFPVCSAGRACAYVARCPHPSFPGLLRDRPPLPGFLPFCAVGSAIAEPTALFILQLVCPVDGRNFLRLSCSCVFLLAKRAALCYNTNISFGASGIVKVAVPRGTFSGLPGRQAHTIIARKHGRRG